ncbi:kinase-like protein [Rhizophagus irregularis]|uniref:Kinase-like protein n=1 Tax=Rhizophagus irregularis TaxID=588596 RepID=A0A2I1GLL9_9GLOM|nr:kinase-like protein [Rhizophagus irregularis]
MQQFAKEIASAISWLHDDKGIIHGDLHPGNILIHQHTIKIADFGCSRLDGLVIYKKDKAYGVMLYMDPKILKDHSVDLTKKSDIYSLAVLFWQLTSCKPPFESETEIGLKIRIINGQREIPIPNTNSEYLKLYQKCWELEPDDRPDISEIVTILKSISPEKNNTIANFEESEITKELVENYSLSCQLLRLETDTENTLKILLDDVKLQIKCYEPQNFKKLTEISFGGFASVYAADWKNATIFAIKKFRNSCSMEEIINEVFLTEKVDFHPNIIKFCGVTKFKDEKNYSLVLEYANGGTLREYLRNNAITFEWKNQLEFAKEIASAISWLHDDKGIIHGDLHPGNILIHQHTIKIADFGCSRLDGSVIYKKEKAYGVMLYMDPKILKDHSVDLTKKSDIYSLVVLFWQLTSCKPPFDSETEIGLKIRIINGQREIPIPNTNSEYVKLYQTSCSTRFTILINTRILEYINA